MFVHVPDVLDINMIVYPEKDTVDTLDAKTALTRKATLKKAYFTIETHGDRRG